LLLHRKDERLAVLLSGAAYRLRNISEPVTSLNKSELLKSFRPEITPLIDELNATKTIQSLDELIQLTPPGLFEMMRIKGLGGKKLSALWNEAGIDTIDMLLHACKSGKLSEIPGFGARTQQNIINSIEIYRSNEDNFHYASMADSAETLVQRLQEIYKRKLISLCGEVRRQSTTVAKIEIITTISPKELKDNILRKYLVIQSSNKEQTKGHTPDEIPVIIYHTTKNRFYDELFKRTGNEDHVAKVLTRIKGNDAYSSEKAIYKKAGLAYIIPEMREDVAEWNFQNKADDLVTVKDIKGVVHNHTTWSDGIDSLQNFVMACKNRKYEYVVISDHSKNAHYAGGLKEDKIRNQLTTINELNKELAPFRIFKSIECDILVSGELDYNEDVLGLFDLVIVSVHQLLKMNEEKALRD
jgi:DNA polymerase (family 10)